MPNAFTAPVDIMNRALWHLGVPPISSPGDMNNNATTVNFLYDKIRRRELRRNVWRFATKRVALRPLSTSSIILTFTPWSITISYPGGAIVSSGGANWINSVETNLGNTPGTVASGWSPYYGPLVATPWNHPLASTSPGGSNPFNPVTPQGPQYGAGKGTTPYFTGELVYLPKGDGTCLFFQALSTLPPSQEGPFLTSTFDAGTLYASGQIVASTLGNPIILGNSGIATPINTGSFLNAGLYQSTVDLNVGNNPDIVVNAAPWIIGQTYSIGDVAVGSEGQIYVSLVAGNVGNDPFLERFLNVNWQPINMWSGTWTSVLTPNLRAISNQWQLIGATPSNLIISYPLTAGPLESAVTMNAFRLPAGFLREAPPDPKDGGIGYLGVNLPVLDTDWTWEDNYIISARAQPIILRFVADVIDVPTMDDMFCEGIGASIAVAAAPKLAPDKLGAAIHEYEEIMGDARNVNAIETGAVQPPVDEYLVCRA